MTTAPKLTVEAVENLIGPIEGFAYNGHGAWKRRVDRRCSGLVGRL